MVDISLAAERELPTLLDMLPKLVYMSQNH
jgi:hypothetical protein